MSGSYLGVDPTQVTGASDTPEFALGTVVEDKFGNRFVYCRANGAVAVDFPVAIDINWDIVDGAGVLADGVSMAALADNEYGWVQISGKHANANVKDALTAGMILAYLADGNGDLLEISATSATTGAHNARGKLLENVAAGVADVLLFPWL